jgi:hypothetical protein
MSHRKLSLGVAAVHLVSTPLLHDGLDEYGQPAYVVVIKTKLQSLGLSCLLVGLLEGLLAALTFAALQSPQGAYAHQIPRPNLHWLVIILACFLNFAGSIPVFLLNLLDSHPVAGWILIFVVGSLYWVLLVWLILIKEKPNPFP